MTSKEVKVYLSKQIMMCEEKIELYENVKASKDFIELHKNLLDFYKTIEKSLDLLDLYKNIEKELGIDLVTLCESFEEDIYIKSDNKIIFVKYDKKEFRFYEGNINCNTDDGNFTISIYDYGKTWALTKEELKNDL